MIQVTHALADKPEVFDTMKFGVEDGVLHIFHQDGQKVVALFNREVWAALEMLEEGSGGTLQRSSQVET